MEEFQLTWEVSCNDEAKSKNLQTGACMQEFQPELHDGEGGQVQAPGRVRLVAGATPCSPMGEMGRGTYAIAQVKAWLINNNYIIYMSREPSLPVQPRPVYLCQQPRLDPRRSCKRCRCPCLPFNLLVGKIRRVGLLL